MKKIFISGTDTGVGKTHATCALLRALTAHKLSVLGLKPVASGAQLLNGQWCNEDALAIHAAMSRELRERYSLSHINPYCFRAAVAPHIAAEEECVALTVKDISSRLAWAEKSAHELVFVEGAGGWLVPLNAQESFADFAQQFCHGVILVVGMRLGCINHALLSQQAIQASGLPLLGWIANSPSETMNRYQDNLAYLKAHMSAALIGELQYQQTDFTLTSRTIAQLME